MIQKKDPPDLLAILFKKLKNLEKKTGWKFRNPKLLLNSVSHASFVNERRDLKLQSNERLEFLGDSVLGLVISQYLMRELPAENEGVLSIKRSALVRESTLAKLARSLRLSSYLILGKGEKRAEGHRRDSSLADTLEAIFGAIYLDAGLPAVEAFILRIYEPFLKELHSVEHRFNFKNTLQQLAHKKNLGVPRYKLFRSKGSQHEPLFKVSLYIGNKYFSWGQGPSIKKAEHAASRNALRKLETRFGLSPGS
jgi:ribonuclease-3